MKQGIGFFVKINGHYIDQTERQVGTSLADMERAKIFTQLELLGFLTRKLNVPADKQCITDIEIMLIEE